VEKIEAVAMARGSTRQWRGHRSHTGRWITVGYGDGAWSRLGFGGLVCLLPATIEEVRGGGWPDGGQWGGC
jgi:hypothetical protein